MNISSMACKNQLESIIRDTENKLGCEIEQSVTEEALDVSIRKCKLTNHPESYIPLLYGDVLKAIYCSRWLFEVHRTVKDDESYERENFRTPAIS